MKEIDPRDAKEMVDLALLIDKLPINLRDVTRLVAKKLTIRQFSLREVSMRRSDGKEIIGLEIMSLLPNEEANGVTVMEFGNIWYIAILDENKNSRGGWERDTHDTSADDVVEAVIYLLSTYSKN